MKILEKFEFHAFLSFAFPFPLPLRITQSHTHTHTLGQHTWQPRGQLGIGNVGNQQLRLLDSPDRRDTVPTVHRTHEAQLAPHSQKAENNNRYRYRYRYISHVQCPGCGPDSAAATKRRLATERPRWVGAQGSQFFFFNGVVV